MFLPTGLTVGKACLQLLEAAQLGLSYGFGDVGPAKSVAIRVF